MNMPQPKIERLAEGHMVSEGPFWDVHDKVLYYVDIFRGTLNKYDPATKKHNEVTFGGPVSFMIRVRGKNNIFVVGAGHHVQIVSWDGESDKVSILQTIDSIENASTLKLVFNDAKCDSNGTLWAGSLVMDVKDLEDSKPLGSLYKLGTDGKLEVQLDNVKISNGLAFDDKANKMYYVDSLSYGIDQYDYDLVNGAICNKRTWFSFKKFDVPGMPDGMTIDSDGNLWVASFGGGRVLKIDGKKPETLLQTIQIPSLQVSSVTFGGENLDELYVTTAALEIMGMKPEPPIDGAVYKVTGLGVRGNPPNEFNDNAQPLLSQNRS